MPPEQATLETCVAPGPALIILSARNKEQLQECAKRLLAHVSTHSLAEADLPHIAYTLQVGREALEDRLAFAVLTIKELQSRLTAYIEAKGREGDGYYVGEVKRHKEAFAIFNTDEALQRTISAWINEGRYGKVLALWTMGLGFDWSTLYGEEMAYAGEKPRRISLPTYPFAKERYWVDVEDAGAASDTAASLAASSRPEEHLDRVPQILRKQWYPILAEPAEPAGQVDRKCIILVDDETRNLGNIVAARLPGDHIVLRAGQTLAAETDWRDVRRMDRPGRLRPNGEARR